MKTAHRTLVRCGDVAHILRELAQDHGIQSVMVEAGGQLVADLLEKNLVDECVIYLAPMITGGLPAVASAGGLALHWKDVEWSRFDDDLRFRACVEREDFSQSGK